MAIILPNGSAPGTPAAGKIELYAASSDKKLKQIDENGLVRTFLEEAAAQYRLIRVTHIFQGTVSYTPTSGADALFVECVGAGGAGGGTPSTSTQASAGAGGGSGAYACLFTTSIKAFTVQVGAGGVGSSNATGGTGTDTTFDSPSICTAKGGVGGGAGVAAGTSIAATSLAGGSGGAVASCVGDMKMNGQVGGDGYRFSGTVIMCGPGGCAPGLGGAGAPITNLAAGAPGSQKYGGGGGGSGATGTQSAQAGANGADGVIRVWEYQAIT